MTTDDNETESMDDGPDRRSVSVEQVPPFRVDETYREQPALYCTECDHPVTAFVDGNNVYVGCLRKNKKVSGEAWSKWDGKEDMFDSWEPVPTGFWQGVTAWMVETIRSYLGGEPDD